MTSNLRNPRPSLPPLTLFASDSPSPSPIRQNPAYELDPLLRSLSPEATLQALSSADAVPKNEKTAHDILSQSISRVSPADRALGIRAAVAAKNLTLWYKEVQSWDWPKRADAHLGKAFIPPAVPDPEVGYYGSLPSAVVEQHETRIDEIRDGLESLGVDELKEHVLNAHIPSRSRPSSSNSAMSVPPPLSYVQLSDFTAVVTATILRALPILSRLNTLLSTWDVRLLVLRQIPGLLRSLRVTRAVLEDAFSALKSRVPPAENDTLYSRTNFYAKQAELSAAVAAAGGRMDNVLDALEGREDSLPENWIDDLEAIESEFSSWVVEAEKRAAENEWMRTNAVTNEVLSATPDTSRSDETPRVSEPVANESDSARRNDRPFHMETIEEEEPSTTPVSDCDTVDKHSPLPPAGFLSNQTDSQVPVHAEAREDDKARDSEPTSQPELQPPEITSPANSDASSLSKQVQNSSTREGQSSSPSSQVIDSGPSSPEVQHTPSSDAQNDTEPAKPVDTEVHSVDKAPESEHAGIERPVTTAPVEADAPVSAKKESSDSSPELSKPHSEAEKEPASNGQQHAPLKHPLKSPIKLSSTKQGRGKKGKLRRRASDTSIDSLSDYPSLISSPEAREPRTASSGTPLFLDAPPQFQLPGFAPNSDHTLREDRLRRFDQKASPRMLKHNRAVSLPLQRFINERMDMNYDDAMDASPGGRRPFTASPPEQQDTTLSGDGSTTHNIQRLASQRLELPRDTKSTSRPKGRLSEPWEHKKAPLRNSGQRSLNSQPPARLATTRLSKELKTHPSSESLGSRGRYGSRPPSRATTPADIAARKSSSRQGSGASTPNKKQKKDHLDEKISTILDTLPARIQLLSGAQEDSDTSCETSSAHLKPTGRFRSASHGTVSRCGTPAPSLTLTPALSRRRTHAHGPEESSVKLYHLHRGGKTNPTKLFVRSVGENGERVMVRVGGGWADLGEYLREYAIHHGRRHVSDTPRVEVQGLSSHDSPAYSSPGHNNMLTPTPTSNGRRTPSRPRSVISNRPSSSVGIRKTRRASNVSDATDSHAPSASAPSTGGEPTNISYSPLSSTSPARRLSVSSNNSAGATSLASEAHHGSSSAHSPATTIAAGSSRSTPLGLAGPKPRSRQVSMDPESEAWVEDVLGQTRRSSSLRPVKFGIPEADEPLAPEQAPGQSQAQDRVPTLPKVRSVSDMGTVGTSRRVALRGLGNNSRRSSRQG